MKILDFKDIKDIYIEVLVLGWKIKIVDDCWVLVSDSNTVWTLKNEKWSSKWQP